MIVPEFYVHFTSRRDAEAIVASGMLLLSRTITGAVYAAPVGGSYVPGVQRGGGGVGVDEAEAREAAVLFTVAEDPDAVFPEEAIWRRTSPLPLADAAVIDHDEAVAMLDGSAGITDAWAWE